MKSGCEITGDAQLLDQLLGATIPDLLEPVADQSLVRVVGMFPCQTRLRARPRVPVASSFAGCGFGRLRAGSVDQTLTGHGTQITYVRHIWCVEMVRGYENKSDRLRQSEH